MRRLAGDDPPGRCGPCWCRGQQEAHRCEEQRHLPHASTSSGRSGERQAGRDRWRPEVLRRRRPILGNGRLPASSICGVGWTTSDPLRSRHAKRVPWRPPDVRFLSLVCELCLDDTGMGPHRARRPAARRGHHVGAGRCGVCRGRDRCCRGMAERCCGSCVACRSIAFAGSRPPRTRSHIDASLSATEVGGGDRGPNVSTERSPGPRGRCPPLGWRAPASDGTTSRGHRTSRSQPP